MPTFFPTWKENPLMTVFVSLFFIFLSAFLAFKIWNLNSERAYIGYVRDTITIDGEGKVAGKPTLARLEVGLYSEGQDVASVQDANSKKVNQIIAAMKQLGIADEDVQTSNYYIAPKFNYDQGKQSLEGYTVAQNLSVKIRQLSRVGEVLSKSTLAGANQVNGLVFTIDDPKDLQLEARKQAMIDAKTKAQETAQALGVRIVRVVTFSEATTPTTPMYYRDMGGSAPMSTGVVPDIQSGSLDVTSRVSVTFEVR